MKLSNRVDELESRLAHQDHTISQLDEVVTRQQDQLDKLEASLNKLAHRLQNQAGNGERDQDEVPPHY